MNKIILIFFDGTWNDENGRADDGLTTNVYKMFSMCHGNQENYEDCIIKRADNQISIYLRGIGNDEDNTIIGQYLGGILGIGERAIRDKAIKHITDLYKEGDRLALFGFSRGAACARMTASSLDKMKIDRGKGDYKVSVDFLGIYDTVGAFGIPINLGFKFQRINLFKNMTIAKSVKKVVHLVAIDETREAFTPTLCNYQDKVEEVWFSGSHADVGGGYKDTTLSDICLAFMCRRLQEAGYRKCFNEKFSIDDSVKGVKPKVHYNYNRGPQQERELFVMEDDEPCYRLPKIHSSVLITASRQRLGEIQALLELEARGYNHEEEIF